MCICLSVAVNVGGVLEVRVCLRTDNCHSHFGKIKIMRCLCVCVQKKNRSQLLQHQCATHTRFCLRLDFPILRSKEVPQIYGIFLFLISHQDHLRHYKNVQTKSANVIRESRCQATQKLAVGSLKMCKFVAQPIKVRLFLKVR